MLFQTAVRLFLVVVLSLYTEGRGRCRIVIRPWGAAGLSWLAGFGELPHGDRVVRRLSLAAFVFWRTVLFLTFDARNHHALARFLAIFLTILLRRLLARLLHLIDIVLGRFLVASATWCSSCSVDIGPRRRSAVATGVVVRAQVPIPDHILALDLDVHRPGRVMALALDHPGDDIFFGGVARLVPRARLEVGRILHHYFVAADLHRLAAAARVAGHARVRVRD